MNKLSSAYFALKMMDKRVQNRIQAMDNPPKYKVGDVVNFTDYKLKIIDVMWGANDSGKHEWHYYYFDGGGVNRFNDSDVKNY